MSPFERNPFEHVSSLSLGFVLSRKWEAGEAELWK